LDNQKNFELMTGFIKDENAKNNIEKLLQHIDYNEATNESELVKISLVMLVKNQRNNILEVLNRIKKLKLEELHVVDTGSEDGTLDILKKNLTSYNFMNCHG
jgi:hypothetical protein